MSRAYKQQVQALVPGAYCVYNRHFEGTVPLLYSVRGVGWGEVFGSTATKAWEASYSYALARHWEKALEL